MSQLERSASDFRIIIDGVTYQMLLHEDEGGVKHFNDGVAPMLSPQFNTGGFGYQNVPPEIEVIESFEHWSGGAGFDIVQSSERHYYHYTRGIDLSYGDRAFVELKRQAAIESDGTAIAAAPSKFFYSPTFGLFMLAGAYIYEFDLSTSAWVVRDDASGDGVSYTDMAEIDGQLIAARGSTIDYKTSTDGVTWTAYTTEDENIEFLVNRTNGADIAAVWKIKGNIIKANPTPLAAGWVGSDEVGHTSQTNRGMAVVDNNIYVFKDDGFHLYTGAATQDLWSTSYITSTNGKNPRVDGNGNILVTYGDQLHGFNPYGNTNSPHFIAYPPRGVNSTELLGSITAHDGDDQWEYIAVKNRAGNTYILRGRETGNGWAWHTIKYLGANDCNALKVIGPGVLHATNPGYVFGYGTAAHYVVLPRQDLLPSEDPAVEFETSEGTAYFPYVDYGAQTYPKFLNRGALLGYGLSAGRYATLAYELDRDGTVTDLVEGVSEQLTEANTDGTVDFHLLRAVLKMGTGDEIVTPVVDAFAFGATLNPIRKRVWKPVVLLADGARIAEGGDTQHLPAPSAMRKVLFGSLRRRMTLIDRDHAQHVVRLHDIEPVILKNTDQGGDQGEISVYQLTFLGINPITSEERVGIYDDDDYDAGSVYGAS